MRLFRGRSRDRVRRQNASSENYYPRASSANSCTLGVSIGRQIVELPQERQTNGSANPESCSSRMRVILPEEKEGTWKSRTSPTHLSPSGSVRIVGEVLKSPSPTMKSPEARDDRSNKSPTQEDERIQESRLSWTVTSV